MSDSTLPTGGVFLSYAREDAGAARRIAEAMRAFGVEVWFDENELRGGDTWDSKIRNQIRGCALFIPIISATTQARDEGYFRREWRVALERMQDMAAGVPFLLPVVIDDTPEKGSLVPDEFMRVQWTRMHKGIPSPQFVDHVRKILAERSWKTSQGKPATAPSTAVVSKQAGRRPVWIWALTAVLVLAAAGVLFLRQPASAPTVAPIAKAAAPSPASPPVVAPPAVPEKSIAVLPFANLSLEKENEFFADGVQDDVITNLAKIRDLTVISRTSTLAYRDSAARNLKKIAAELNVTTILEGSIRRVGTKVHMNAQLIDARTDAHLWADTFDGDTSDIFGLQASLAQKIAVALKATLTPGERSLIERRPTRDAQAYELYQRAKLLKEPFYAQSTRTDYEAALVLYEQALAHDPGLALARSDLVFVHGVMYWFGAVDPSPERRAKAAAELAEVRRLAPDAPETRMAQGTFTYLCDNDWAKALVDFQAAAENLPNDDQVQYLLAIACRRLGRWREAVDHLERAVALNPHDRRAATSYIETLFDLRRFDQLPALAPRFLTLFPNGGGFERWFADAQFELDGDRAAWLRRSRAISPAPWDSLGLNLAYSRALAAGDAAGAERAAADPRQNGFLDTGGVANEPTALRRAELASLRGDPEAAGTYANAALVALAGPRSAPRQEQVIRMFEARARLSAGIAGASRELWQATETVVQQDKFLTVTWLDAAQAYAATGHREEALAALRQLLAGPSTIPPSVLRGSPFFASLKPDPRFEEILKSAKPL